jgi:hypothetical protein
MEKAAGMILVSEAAYQAFDQKEYIRQGTLQKENDRRMQIAKAICPCFESIPDSGRGVSLERMN